MFYCFNKKCTFAKKLKKLFLTKYSYEDFWKSIACGYINCFVAVF